MAPLDKEIVIIIDYASGTIPTAKARENNKILKFLKKTQKSIYQYNYDYNYSCNGFS